MVIGRWDGSDSNSCSAISESAVYAGHRSFALQTRSPCLCPGRVARMDRISGSQPPGFRGFMAWRAPIEDERGGRVRLECLTFHFPPYGVPRLKVLISGLLHTVLSILGVWGSPLQVKAPVVTCAKVLPYPWRLSYVLPMHFQITLLLHFPQVISVSYQLPAGPSLIERMT